MRVWASRWCTIEVHRLVRAYITDFAILTGRRMWEQYATLSAEAAQLLDRRQSGSYPETGLWEARVGALGISSANRRESLSMAGPSRLLESRIPVLEGLLLAGIEHHRLAHNSWLRYENRHSFHQIPPRNGDLLLRGPLLPSLLHRFALISKRKNALSISS